MKLWPAIARLSTASPHRHPGLVVRGDFRSRWAEQRPDKGTDPSRRNQTVRPDYSDFLGTAQSHFNSV